MLTVIVTGGIGSGKTAVCDILLEKGVPVYDSDVRTKSLYNTVPGLVSRLERELGASFTTPEGTLDRKALASLVFSNPAALEKLEAIVYPLVREDFEAWRMEQSGAPLVVLESAVILSKPVFDGVADAVVAVTAPEDKRIARLMRRGLSEEDARRRMAAQDPDISKAGAIIDNSGSREDLIREVERVFFAKNGYICKLDNK